MANTTNHKTNIEIVADGKQVNATLNQMAAAVRVLEKELKKLPKDSKEFADKAEELSKVKTEYKNITGEVINLNTASKKTWDTIKQGMLGVLGGNLLTSVIQGIGGFFKSMITYQADLSDEYANIRKVTNLTNDEIEKLDKKFKGINTRTPRKELRELAVEAGKLGIEGVENIARFVQEADQIKVALGEDLGPEAITQIGRLSNIFKVSMLEIGSAINDIGAKSAATESYQVDFLNRLAGTGPTAELAAFELLGYSATLENAGQTAEVSGTAISKFMIDFIKDVEKFGKIAGMQEGALTKIFDEQGTNAAFLTFLKNLKEGKSNTTEFAKSLDEMGIDGARSVGVFLALANNIDEVNKQQEIAFEAISKGTSLTDEFNIKNETFGAQLEKLGKRISNFVKTNPLTTFFTNLLKIMVKNFDALVTIGKILTIGVIAWGTYRTVVFLATITQTAFWASLMRSNLFLGLQRIALAAAAFAQAIFTGNTMAAGVAMAAFNRALSLNPIGLITTLLVTGYAAFKMWGEKVDESVKAQNALNDAMTEAKKRMVDEKFQVEQLLKTAQNENESKQKRIEAIRELNKISPEYLGNLNLENINTLAAKKSLDLYLKSLEKKYRIEVLTEKLKENQRKILDEENKNLSENSGWLAKQWASLKDRATGGVQGTVDLTKEELQVRKENIASIEKENELMESQLKQLLEENDIKAEGEANTNTNLQTRKELLEEIYALENAMNKQHQFLDDKSDKQLEKYLNQLKFKQEHGYFKPKRDVTPQEKGALGLKLPQKFPEQREFTFDNDNAVIIDREKMMKRLNDVRIALHLKYLEKELEHTIKGTQEEFDIRMQMINDHEKAELNNFDGFEEEKTKIKEYYENERHEASMQRLKEETDKYKGYFDDIMAINDQLVEANRIKTEKQIALAQKEETAKLTALEKRLTKGEISEEQYAIQKERIEKEFNDRKRELNREQWQKEQNARMIKATAEAIVATIKAYADGGPYLAAVVAAANGILVANLANTPVPEFASGGLTVTGQSGRRYNATNVGSLANGGVFNQPSYGIVGERGPELVIPNYLYTNPKMANTMAMLEHMIGVREYAAGGKTTQSNSIPGEIQALIASNTMIMSKLLDRLESPIEAVAYLNPVKADEYEKQLTTIKSLSKLTS